MGVSASGGELGAKFDRFVSELRNTRGPLTVTATAVKRDFVSAASSAGAMGVKLSGKRKPIAARYDFLNDHAVSVFYTGPAHILNNPTGAHRIEPRNRRGGRRRRRGATALTINGSVRAWANHPGTRGKHFFQRARQSAVREAPRVFGRESITQSLRKVF